MERSQFTFYESFRKAIGRIKKKADRADAYDAICDYALYGTEPNLDTLPDAAAIAFELIRPNLDASRRRATSGKAGGAAKQDASKPEANAKQTPSKPEANVKQTGSKRQANPKQGETASKKEKEKEKEIEIEKEDECLNTRTGAWGGVSDELLKTLKDFEEMRKKIKAPMTDRAKELLLSDLRKMTDDEATQIAILEKSIKRSWKGIFELKDEKRKGNDRGGFNTVDTGTGSSGRWNIQADV